MKDFIINKKLLLLLVGTFIYFGSYAQKADTLTYEQLKNMTLEDLIMLDFPEDLMRKYIEVISATKNTQKISEAPAIISVITAQQIKQRGYQNVAEAIESLPGIDVLNDHVQYNAGVRGVNGGMRAWSRIIKVMIDNQPISYRATAENFLGEELIPINVVERIEVIRGPSSALYGANAFLGVINIITKKGEQVDGGIFSGQAGLVQNNFAYGGGLVIGKKIKDLDFIASFNHGYTDRSGLKPQAMPGKNLSKADSASQNDISEPLSVFSKVSYGNNKMGKIGVDFNYQQINKFGEFQDYALVTHQNHINIENWYVRGTYNKDLTKKLNTSIGVAYSKGNPIKKERLTTNSLLGIADWITRDVGYKGVDANAEISYSIDEVTNIRLGVDHTSDNQKLQTYYYNFNDKPKQSTYGQILGDTTFSNTGVYLQSNLYPFRNAKAEFIQRLGITAGARYDIHNIYGNVFNFRIATVYPISEKVYSKLMYGTSFRAPASTQLYTTLLAAGDVIGNADLKPEKASTAEFALGADVTKALKINLNLFHNVITNKVEFIKDGSNIKAANVAEITSSGFESDLSYKHKELSSYLNFSYQKSKIKEIEGTSDSKLYPSFMVKGGLNLGIPKIHLNFSTEGKFISSRIASNQNIAKFDPINKSAYSLGSYFLLDLAVSTQNIKLFAEKETFLRFKVSNLLDTKYYFPGYNNYDIPGLNRSYTVSLIQNF